MKTREIEISKRVVKEARELFFDYGYTAVTAQLIAEKAGISKKTLYRYFISKKEILNQVVNQVLNKLSFDIYQVLLKENLSYPQKLQEIISHFAVSLSSIKTEFLADIQRQAPDIWKKVVEFKRDTVINHFGKLYDEGVKIGQINKTINKNIAILILMSSINNLFNPIFLEHLPEELKKNVPDSAYEMYNEIIKVLYEGILAEKTKKQYIKKLKV